MTNRIVLGLDCGASGALALFSDGEPDFVIDLPVVERKSGGMELNGVELANHLREILRVTPGSYVEAAVESVSAMPGQGVSSMFKFGESYGRLRGILEALRIPYRLVPPAVWKRSAGLIGTEKDVARGEAIRRWPKHADRLSRKKDGGRADALWIGHWLVRQQS